MADFIEPSFLQNMDIETIHKRMLNNLQPDIDKSEGGMAWDLTFPTAYEISFFAEFFMIEAIKMIFPMFCGGYDDVMDYHASGRGITRKPAAYAVGELTITGDNETVIPAGTEFSTVSVDDEENIVFYTTQDAVITDTSVKVPIMAAVAGTVGNVEAGTIILKQNSISGIKSAINEEATTGGTEEETTESLQARIVEYDKTQWQSFVGNVSDYKRWALSVLGTGNAVVVPAQDDSGLVTIILTDTNGDPATTKLCTDVYNYIMSPDYPENKLAPIGAKLSVLPPSTVYITVSAIVELDGTVSIDDIKTNYIEKMKSYLSGTAADESEIKYTKVGSILSNIAGVKDYKSLKLNDGTSNVAVLNTQIAVCNSITLTTGEV